MGGEAVKPTIELYHELPSSGWIRLFKFETLLLPGKLKITLKPYPLSGCPPFTAISYTWGECKGHRRLLINGLSRPIWKNLWECLIALRRRKRLKLFLPHLPQGDARRKRVPNAQISDWFWADAICINQDSIDEKNLQVSQIDQVFSGAEDVWAWLGNEPAVQDLVSDYRRWRKNAVHSTNNPDLDEKLDQVAYFGRTWVVQEMVLAKSFKIFAGKRVHCGFDNYNDSFSSNTKKGTAIYFMLCFRRFHGREVSISLLELISKFGHSLCSNPLDKVFALQSLANMRFRLKVDYRAHPADLYWLVLAANTTECSYRDSMNLATALNVTLSSTARALTSETVENWTRKPSIFVAKAPNHLGTLEEMVQDYSVLGDERTVDKFWSMHELALGDFRPGDYISNLCVQGQSFAVLRPLEAGNTRYRTCGLLLRSDVPTKSLLYYLFQDNLGMRLLNGTEGTGINQHEVEVVWLEEEYWSEIRVSPRVFDDMCRWKEKSEPSYDDTGRDKPWHHGYGCGEVSLKMIQAMEWERTIPSREWPHQ